MWAAPLLLVGLASAAPSPTVLSASDRAPLALLLVTPTGEPGRVSRSEAIRSIGEALERETELRAQTVDPIVNADCRGRLACIIARLRDTETRAGPDWLLVVTQITLEGELDRMSSTLVALAALPSGADEDAIDRVRRQSAPVQVASGAELEGYVEDAIRGPFAGPLEAADRLRAPGSIVLAPTTAGALVHLDDRPLGLTGEGPTRIVRVRPGRHRLRLTAPGTSPWEAEVEIHEDAPRATLVPAIASRREDGAPFRTALVTSGAALAVAGATLVAIAAFTAEGEVKTACFETRDGCAGGAGFIGFDYDPEAPAPREVDPNGLPMAPLGAALFLGGTTLAVGALIEDREVPWWTLGLAVVAGGAALATGLALDEGSLP